MSVNNIQDKVKFVLIESLKLQLLSKFMCETECMKYEVLGETDGTNEILFENEAGIIFKRYLPNLEVNFDLPNGDYKAIFVGRLNDIFVMRSHIRPMTSKPINPVSIPIPSRIQLKIIVFLKIFPGDMAFLSIYIKCSTISKAHRGAPSPNIDHSTQK